MPRPRLLEVVEEDQHVAVADEGSERATSADRLRRVINDQVGSADRGERHPPDAVAIVARSIRRSLDCEPRLAGAARADERNDPSVGPGEEPGDFGKLTLGADERCRGQGQVRPTQVGERRKRTLGPPGRRVRAPRDPKLMAAEIHQLRVNQASCLRVRHEDLPGAARRCDPGGPMEVVADVALVNEKWRSGVNADPDVQRPRSEVVRDLLCGSNCAVGSRECEEECVALRVDFDPVVPVEGSTNDGSMGRQGVRIARWTELAQEPGRTSDISEHERDGAGRKVARHRREWSPKVPAPSSRHTVLLSARRRAGELYPRTRRCRDDEWAP